MELLTGKCIFGKDMTEDNTCISICSTYRSFDPGYLPQTFCDLPPCWWPLLVFFYWVIITLTSLWPRWRLKSPTSRLFTQPFIHTQMKTSKLRVTDLCVGNSPGPVNSPHKGPVTRKMFPFDDVIMCMEKYWRIATIHMVTYHQSYLYLNHCNM